MLPVEATKYSANTTADVGYQYEHHTGMLWTETSALQSIFSVIRRRKNSEAVHGIHVRMAAIPSENGDFVRWRLVSIEGNQYERYDGFADTQALKVFPVDCKGSRSTSHRARTSQDYCNHGRHFACFHTNMDELIHAHPPRETDPDGIVVWLLFKALILEQGEQHDCGRSTLTRKYS